MLLFALPVRINTNDIVIIVFWVAEVQPLLGLLSLTQAYKMRQQLSRLLLTPLK